MKKSRIIFFLILILGVQLLLCIPFLHESLEGDEGVYASIAQGVLAGEIPYRDFFDHKPPVVYYVYALIFKFFGETLLSIRLFTAFFGLLGTLGLFWVGFRLWGQRTGLFTAAFYAFFSGGPLIEGTSSNTESFMIVFVIFALLAYILALKNNSGSKIYGLLLLSGFFSGLAVMTKQVALFNFLILLGFLIPYRDFKRIGNWNKSICLISGSLIVPLFFIIYFWANKGLSDFINFAFLFNFGYIQSGFNPLLLVRTFYIAVCENSIIWILSFAAFFYILLRKRTKWNLLVVLWAIFSSFGIASGGHYFGHYYIQIIPALCLLSGYALAEIRPRKISLNIFAIFILLFFCLIIVLNQYEFYFKYSPEEISYYKYAHSYNVIAQEISKEIVKRTKPGDFVQNVGLPQIHFYTKRRGPSKYYNYSLGEEGRYKVYLFGQEVYDRAYKYRIDEEFSPKAIQDLVKGLNNSRTKFVLIRSEVFIPKDFNAVLREKFVYSKELSDKTGNKVLVFERIKP